MNTKALPDKPNLERLKKQADELLHLARSNDSQAIQRIQTHHPKYSERIDASQMKHGDALLVIAREYGFSSWPALKQRVETALLDRSARVAAFVSAAVNGQMERAVSMLEKYPDLGNGSVALACIVCDAEEVARFLKANPDCVHDRFGKHKVVPLCSLSFSHFHTISERHEAGKLKCAELLLDHGADPDSAIVKADDPNHPMPALYGACGTAYFPPLARLLIERGANVNDNESLYHSCEHRDHECMKLLLENGAKIEGTNALFRMLNFEDPEGLRLLLDCNPNPDERIGDGGTMLHCAARDYRGDAILQMLVDYGVDIHAVDKSGRSAYEVACRYGNSRAADFLLRNGAENNLSQTDRFLAVCARADADEAKQTIAAHPGMVDSLSGEDLKVMVNAAQKDNPDAVKILIEAGFDIAARGEHGGTALHWAAWHGNADLAKTLIEHNAPLEMRCHGFGCTPLMWAAHGADNCMNPKGDYVRTIKTLLDAGADISLRNKWNELLLPEKNKEAADYLVARGAEVPGE